MDDNIYIYVCLNLLSVYIKMYKYMYINVYVCI